eukprot:363970-Chlamydomonas_euryale.AAC.15
MGAMPFPETCNPCQHASCQVCQLLRLCGTAAKARQSFAAHLPFCEAEDGRQPCEEALGVSGDFRGLDLLWVELWRIRLGRPQVARPWQHAEEREGEEDAETDKKVHDDGRDNGCSAHEGRSGRCTCTSSRTLPPGDLSHLAARASSQRSYLSWRPTWLPPRVRAAVGAAQAVSNAIHAQILFVGTYQTRVRGRGGCRDQSQPTRCSAQQRSKKLLRQARGLEECDHYDGSPTAGAKKRRVDVSRRECDRAVADYYRKQRLRAGGNPHWGCATARQLAASRGRGRR